MKDELETIKEVAKTTGKAIDAARELGGFFKLVFGDTAVQFGGITHDWAQYYRYKNLLKIYDRVTEIHRERLIAGKTIPLPTRFALPIIEHASLEGDDDIQSLWAALIANATDPTTKLRVTKVYIEILKSLEPLDVEILRYFSTQGWNMVPSAGGGINAKMVATALAADYNDVAISLQNLYRLGCIAGQVRDGTFDDFSVMSFGLMVNDDRAAIRPTPLANSLLKACEAKELSQDVD